MIRREQTEVDEEQLKAMIAGEVSSYRKPAVVNPETSEETNMNLSFLAEKNLSIGNRRISVTTSTAGWHGFFHYLAIT